MPVRVSVAAGFSSVVVAARADTVRFCFVAERTDVRVAVVLFSDRGNKTETGFVARGATTVFTGVLDVTDRVVRMVVPGVFFVLFFSLIIGAVFSVIKMIICGNFRTRIERLRVYKNTVISGRIVTQYYDKKSDGNDGFTAEAAKKTLAPMVRGKRLKVYYGLQVSTNPQTIRLFVNDPKLATPAYLAFIERNIRARFGLEGAPLRMFIKARTRKGESRKQI